MIYEALMEKKANLAVIGLGYVGMPLAIAFGEKVNVIGFDLNKDKIEKYKMGIDPTNEVGSAKLKESGVLFTSEEKCLQDVKFFVVAVPTPINQDKTPDLKPVISATEIVGRNLSRGSIVVYESTVYPGVTEDVCLPILEKESGLTCGVDFKIGYSPERINPSDKVHRLENIKKIVSGMDKESLEDIAKVYELVIKVGVHRAPSIKVAEAAKVVENSQRDINIAFMNELAIVFDKMGIDTCDVVEAMNTKWNALGFTPGLVGGHCIGVDPYYFVYKAENLGYHSQIVAAGRKVNDGMGSFIADTAIKKLIKAGKNVRDSRVVILGITFKENCPDTRNSKVADIYWELRDYGIDPMVVDPIADKEETLNEYGIFLKELDEIQDADCLIFAVAHDMFKGLGETELNQYFMNGSNEEKVLIDVKGILDRDALKNAGYVYWCL